MSGGLVRGIFGVAMTPSVTLAEKHPKRHAASTGAARTLELAPEVPPFDFLESRIQVPPLRPESVSRTALVNKLRAATVVPLATIVAPAGYGKTTLLSQWAARDSRPFAWVSIDDRDNDPAVLLRHIAAALAEEAPLPRHLVASLRAMGPSIWTAAVPRLSGALRARGPLVLVLDDASALRSRDSLEAIASLVDDCADGSMLVLSGRVSPRIALAPLRAGGRLFELGAEELAFKDREAQVFLRATDVRLSEAAEERIVERSEGWPAALYLAALAIRDTEQPEREALRFSGENRYLADYIRSEYLSGLRPATRRFLRRTSALDRMSGSLCDAVLDDEGSARELAKIERANVFLVALDTRRGWFRYHGLLRGLLRRELVENEPELVPVLHRRAADWYEAHGDPESALGHAYAADDTERAAAIFTASTLPLYYSGRVKTLESWLGRFELAGLSERDAALAVHGCRLHLVRGRRDDARRLLDFAERGVPGSLPDASGSMKPWIAVVRAWMCESGVAQMLADADSALVELPEESDWRPAALLARGAALALLGEDARADACLSDAVSAAESRGAGETKALGLSLRALLLARRDEHEVAEQLSAETQRTVTSDGVEGLAARALGHATSSRVLLRDGHWKEACAQIAAALELTPLLTDAVPWLSMLVRLELAHGLVTLRNRESAVALLAEVDELARICPDALSAELEEVRREVDALAEVDSPSQTGLTPAELRLLPLLATHLSFREIGEELYVSRNTVKTQAISVYRKLGVSSRSEAISEARRLGLGKHLRVLIEV